MALIAGGTGGGIALAANRGPSKAQRAAIAAAAAQKRQAELEAAEKTAAAQLAALVTFSPVQGATNVPLDSPVKVTVPGGKVTAVTVNGGGGALPGTLNPSTGQWTASAGFAPATAYTVTAVVAGNGVTATRSASFTTMTSAATTTATVFPTEGMSVGVGQPIVVRFSRNVPSAVRPSVESRFTVAMTNVQPGGWYWFNDHEMDFRPKSYWTAHEAVRVTANLNGIDLGDGVWTAGAVLDNFAIGDARVSYADLSAEEMTVTENGATLYRFPISGGRTQYPTMDGTHIVLDTEHVVHMVSSTVGIPVNSPNGYDEYVYDDVHISDSGEYVHAAPWSVYAQGRTNVSHGCINVSPNNALTFYEFSRIGDVIVVTGSPRPPAWGDHGVMDWSGPAWSEWAPANVAALPGSATSTTTTATTATTVRTAPVTNAPATTASTRPATTVPSTTTTVRPATTATTHKPATTTTTR
ncbi:MAG TPA: Ig-like domain-containing protein [Acidimicrobiales bacterium]|nr:Ig-like domain-containing protein [Acidimicrobiales bacterium]